MSQKKVYGSTWNESQGRYTDGRFQASAVLVSDYKMRAELCKNRDGSYNLDMLLSVANTYSKDNLALMMAGIVSSKTT